MFFLNILEADRVGYNIAPNTELDTDEVSSILKQFNVGSKSKPIISKNLEITT